METQEQQRTPVEEDPDGPKPFSCHICLDTASEPVVTVCGHLFCWPCISQWLEMAGGNACPVCKAGLKKENMIPIYGKGAENTDPRERPARPTGQRPERESNFFNNFNHFNNFNGGFTFAFGPAVFSTVLGMQGFGYNVNQDNNRPNQTPEQLQQQEREVFAKMMLFMGVLVLLTVLLGV